MGYSQGHNQENADASPGVILSENGSQQVAIAPLLEVQDLHVQFDHRAAWSARSTAFLHRQPRRGRRYRGRIRLRQVDLLLAIMRLLAKATGKVTAGRILFEGRNLLELSDEEMRELRGRDISMIFQEPMRSSAPGRSSKCRGREFRASPRR